MLKLLYTLPLWQIALIGVVILFGGAAFVEFLLALLRELGVQFLIFVAWFREVLRRTGRRALHVIFSFAAILFKLFVIALLWVIGPPCARMAQRYHDALAQMHLAYRYVTGGRKTYASFQEFRETMTEDEKANEFRSNAHNPSLDDLPRVQRALEILGLTTEQAADMRVVKKRYRDLMMIVHPDRGFVNAVFSQLVNEAMDTIKREWGV